MKIDELQKKCEKRRWACNNFSFYMIEVGLTPSYLSHLFEISLSTINYWLYHENLSRPVDSFFLTMRKLYMVHGIRLQDLF